MTTPLPVLPQIIVEAGFTPGAPVQSGAFTLDDAVLGKLDTGTLGQSATWTDLSSRVLAFRVIRPSTRLQGPLWNYQAGTASITFDNSDGALDPDNLAGPYVDGTGATQLAAMVPLRLRAVFGSVAYPLYSGFADGWIPATVTYEGGYAELTVGVTDGFKVLAGVMLPAAAAAGGGEATGARITRILNAAQWYTGGGQRLVSAGNSTVQATTLGSDALALMQAAADAEIGQLYVNGSGQVTFRARHDILTDARSAAPQAVFGDDPGATGMGDADGTFETGVSAWTATGGTVAQSSAQAHSGTFSALVTVSGSPSQAFIRETSAFYEPVAANTDYTASLWVYPTSAGTFNAAIDWLDASKSYISTASGATSTPATNTWTQLTVTGTAPSNAAYARRGPTLSGSPANGTTFYADDVFLWPGDSPLTALPQLPYAAIGRASDDTTIGNDIQATIAGGSNLQEAKDTASIAKYLFPRSYARSDLILQGDPDALSWAQWVLYVSKSGEDRFESLQADPLADPYNLWPQVLGREIGDRIQVWHRPASVASPVVKDCFIAGITHAWDSVSSAWLTTWTLQDAGKYGSFLTLGNATLGQLNHNALTY